MGVGHLNGRWSLKWHLDRIVHSSFNEKIKILKKLFEAMPDFQRTLKVWSLFGNKQISDLLQVID